MTRKRSALIGIGAIVGICVLLVVAGLMVEPKQYRFNNNRDIRDNIAGRWDWQSHKALCGDSSHTIAFSEDGMVMTLTADSRMLDSATGKDWTVTTYDILESTPSRIRGAIRGETRLTKDSVPVVWDLIVVGPNEYRWHQTDWPAFGRTGAIMRCPSEIDIGAPSPAPTRSVRGPSSVKDYYRGTATNHQLRDQPVLLELSVFSRAGDETVGWLDSGAPLFVRGLTYVFEEAEDSLYLVTHATSGDTIIWASGDRTDDIGGEYWVSSSRNAGQGGTWSLDRAPRLEPATLQLLGLALAGAVLFGVLALAVTKSEQWWSWRYRQPLVVPDDKRINWTGIGGWLVVVIVGQSIVAITLLVRLGEVSSDLGGNWMMGAAVGGLRPLLMVESAFHLFQLAGIITGLVLIVRRSTMAPLYWSSYLAMLVAYAIVDIGGTMLIGDRMSEVFGIQAAADFGTGSANAVRQNLRLALSALIWILYWTRSRRVALTFGRGAMYPAASANPEPPAAAPA